MNKLNIGVIGAAVAAAVLKARRVIRRRRRGSDAELEEDVSRFESEGGSTTEE